MRMCLNRNVLIGLGAGAAVVLVVAPQAFLTALPVLAVLACPLSMLLMMRGMGTDQGAGSERNGASCHSPPPPSSPTTTADDRPAEVAHLRAEVDRLRAALRDRQQAHHADWR
jgi:hypothetical protein